MFFLYLVTLDNKLCNPTRDSHHYKSSQYRYDDILQPGITYRLPGINKSYSCRNKHDWHDCDEKTARLTDILHLDPFQLQGDKQQDYTIYTGWYRQWKKIMQKLSQKRESDDYHKLNKKLHDFKLILVSLFVVQTDLLYIALYHRGCFFCSQSVAIQTNVIIIGISPGKPCIILMVCHTTVI